MMSYVAMSLFLLSHATLDTVKNHFLEKNVGEAVFLLKNDRHKILQNPQSQLQVAQWLSTFQYDSTLSFFEKNLELLTVPTVDQNEIEKNFLLALEREPYNTKLLSHSIVFWLNQTNFTKAREKIQWAKKELPFMEIYRVYGNWLGLRDSQQDANSKLSCQSATLLPGEKDFCQYVVFLELVAASKAKKPSAEIMKAFQKTSILNRHFVMWEKWRRSEEKQKYVSSCRALSDKQKKAFLMVPEFCKIDVKDDDKNDDKEANE
jgi:hypothetical protein